MVTRLLTTFGFINSKTRKQTKRKNNPSCGWYKPQKLHLAPSAKPSKGRHIPWAALHRPGERQHHTPPEGPQLGGALLPQSSHINTVNPVNPTRILVSPFPLRRNGSSQIILVNHKFGMRRGKPFDTIRGFHGCFNDFENSCQAALAMLCLLRVPQGAL